MGIFFRKNEMSSKTYGTGYYARTTPRRRSSFDIFDVVPWIIGFGVVAVFIGVIWYQIAWQNSQETYASCTVEEKDRTTNSEGESDMRIYTDCGVFRVGDNFWTFTFASADTYSSIDIGETYDFKTIGWRAPVFSQFPLILEATPSAAE